jgi:hypothetical protein
MALTADLVHQRGDHQRWRLTQDGAAGTTLALATVNPAADIQQACPPLKGKIRAICMVVAQGYGQFALGAQTQAKARALWLSDRTGATPGPAERITTLRCEITARTGTTAPVWLVDADIDGGGNPVINLTAPAAAAVAYLDIEVEGGSIGA